MRDTRQGNRMRLLVPLLIATALSAASGGPPAQASTRPGPEPAEATAPSARDLLIEAIGDRKLVLLGEMHGTQETPALVGELLDAYAGRHRPVILALEIGRGEQAGLARYLASAGAPADRGALLAGPHWREPRHDGRDSEAMFGLIEHARRLRAAGAQVALLAFNHANADMDARNRRMAATLRAAALGSPGATMLVLTGNIHAMTHRPPWEMFDAGKRIEPPMTAGRYLADLSPLSINIRAASGAHWACTQAGCRVQPELPATVSVAPLLQHDGADGAWDYDLLLPRFTPSPPAIAAMAPGTRAVNP